MKYISEISAQADDFVNTNSFLGANCETFVIKKFDYKSCTLINVVGRKQFASNCVSSSGYSRGNIQYPIDKIDFRRGLLCSLTQLQLSGFSIYLSN